MSIGLRMHDTIQASFPEQAAFIAGQGFECVHLALSKVLGNAYFTPEAQTPQATACQTEAH